MKCDTCLKTLTVSTYFCPNCSAKLNKVRKETTKVNPKNEFKISSIEEFKQYQIENKKQEFRNSKILFTYSFLINLGFWFLVYIFFEFEINTRMSDRLMSRLSGFFTLLFIIAIFNIIYRYIKLSLSKI